MTPDEEARFIALWNAHTTTAAMAAQLGIPMGTVSSRAYTLVRQGKIQARPKGGTYPRSKAQGRQEGTPAPPATTAPPAPQVAPAPPAMTFVAVPEIQADFSVPCQKSPPMRASD